MSIYQNSPSINNFAIPLPPSPQPTPPLQLYTDLGTRLGGYQPSIIRPIDDVYLPRDIKRGTFVEKCDYPVYSGAKQQVWCNEQNAIDYYGMRPIIEPDAYTLLLKRLFETVVMRSVGSYDYQGLLKKYSFDVPDPQKFQAVFCSETESTIMNFIMKKIAEAVNVMPEMHKNGPYKIEMFYYTDPTVFQIITEKGNLYYKLIFNLYNALRSVSTLVETVIAGVPSKDKNIDPMIIGMTFASNIEKFSDSGLPAAPIPRIGHSNIVLSDTNPTDVSWLYKNTLDNNEFNKHGFYEDGYNVDFEVSIPENLRRKIQKFENGSKEYLLPAGEVVLGPEGFPKTVQGMGIQIYKASPNGVKPIDKISLY